MFPYHDENEASRTAFITYTFIGLNVLAWFGVQGAGSTFALARSVCQYGLIPGALTGLMPPGTAIPIAEGLVCVPPPGPHFVNVFTSMFMHGGWLHLIGNMWFLWIFGNNVEDSTGRFRFVLFYLICGAAAIIVSTANSFLLKPASALMITVASSGGNSVGDTTGNMLMVPVTSATRLSLP